MAITAISAWLVDSLRRASWRRCFERINVRSRALCHRQGCSLFNSRKTIRWSFRGIPHVTSGGHIYKNRLTRKADWGFDELSRGTQVLMSECWMAFEWELGHHLHNASRIDLHGVWCVVRARPEWYLYTFCCLVFLACISHDASGVLRPIQQTRD